MSEIILQTLEDTARFARAIAAELEPVDCITLTGQIGAGKTAFMRHLLQELTPGVEQVISPSFLLIQHYDVTLPNGKSSVLWHLDGYRLKHSEEIIELGLDEAFETAIICIEWPELFADWLPKDKLALSIRLAEGRRYCQLQGEGHWTARAETLMHTLTAGI